MLEVRRGLDQRLESKEQRSRTGPARGLARGWNSRTQGGTERARAALCGDGTQEPREGQRERRLRRRARGATWTATSPHCLARSEILPRPGEGRACTMCTSRSFVYLRRTVRGQGGRGVLIQRGAWCRGAHWMLPTICLSCSWKFARPSSDIMKLCCRRGREVSAGNGVRRGPRLEPRAVLATHLHGDGESLAGRESRHRPLVLGEGPGGALVGNSRREPLVKRPDIPLDLRQEQRSVTRRPRAYPVHRVGRIAPLHRASRRTGRGG